MTRRIPLVLVLALAAVAGLVAPASARWWGNNGWYEDNRWAGDRWYGYNYRPPPVVYGTPYNYGYYSPPVVYDAAPGISFNIRIP